MVGFGSAIAGLPVWGAEKRRIEKQRDGRGSGLRRPPLAYNNQPRFGRSDNGDVIAEAHGWESTRGDTVLSFGASN